MTAPCTTRTRLSARQRHILVFIRGYHTKHGFPPSLQEIADAVGLASKSTASYQLAALTRDGYIRRVPGRPRALEVLDPTVVDEPHDVVPRTPRTGVCPTCGAVAPAWNGRVGDHPQAVIRGGKPAEGRPCSGAGAVPDVDVDGLDPVVADLASRRVAAGLTCLELAVKAGVDRDTVARMERGTVVSLRVVRALTEALGCRLRVEPGAA